MKKQVVISSLLMTAGILAAAGFILHKKGMLEIKITNKNKEIDKKSEFEEEIWAPEEVEEEDIIETAETPAEKPKKTKKVTE